ncbi:MAG: hypothetical protein Q4D79_09195 [Propionibacteriaceae bacterium]|nr:hypothetical protein [Propionibacteriaceae bacterium]
MTLRRLRTPLVTLAAMIAAGFGLASPATADEQNPSDDPATPVTHEVSHSELENAREFWTKERMENATPMDMPAASGDEQQDPGSLDETEPPIVEPAVPAVSPPAEQPPGTNANGTETENAPVPNTVGRLFFTAQNPDGTLGTGSCTASTTAAGGGSKIITAGHCVHAGDNQTWYSDFVFAPAYYQGETPHGLWFGERAGTFNGWASSGNTDWDQAIIQVERQPSGTIVETLGGNGLIGGSGPDVPGNRIWGYPGQAPFDGELPYYCDGDATGTEASSDSQMACGMNQGASGGPWLKDHINADLGYTWAVTSRCEAKNDDECLGTKLFATPNPREIFNLANI